jgi:NAD(P)-dependent dehydrogenase (short-subunit alcohol dehydrogenase family)
MGWLEGYVAVVTGGGSGIGRAVVDRFVAEGASVVVLEKLTERAAEVEQAHPGKVAGLAGDVRRYEDNEQAVQLAVSRFGKLDVFVANAGVFDMGTRLEDLDPARIGDAFDELFSINVKGYLLGAKAALPELRKTAGSIIFTASQAGVYPGGGGSIYTASKHAVIGLMRQLSLELGPAVRVNAVAPTGVRTDLRGLAALGSADVSTAMRQRPASARPRTSTEPEDHAGAYVYLASKENSGVTMGAIMDTTNGMIYRRYALAQAAGEPSPWE